jgi:hypothetical protein
MGCTKVLIWSMQMDLKARFGAAMGFKPRNLF